ncbi:dTDP-4-dehydrorhamnose 3,5-epimerase [Usitatibacter palustris]|uniref:dTDP-4-dehydrorhamnose 3,5-epimerase n=1 Tax=Usitatibacter palustris TaxID=2732487 RepID=A0A6M4HDA1_9PROT|nr:dTDP-4-dehydrorhamnose 3,5-epimerase [Usitatibacter palustris]QJR16513.1 dTDP-4-dehydrorhamnose 3,5-epimerase [Usitatibacter palustris]
MKFATTLIPGLVVVDVERREDARGFFGRSFCAEEFARAGLDARVAQCSVSHNAKRGTLRGMHWQAEPHAEAKLVRCTAGAIFDVALDLRPDSPTFRKWVGFELTADNHRALYIPPGFGHGFQTLADNSEVYYQMSVPYVPEASRGARWNDPSFAIRWPVADPVVSERDAGYADFAA